MRQTQKKPAWLAGSVVCRLRMLLIKVADERRLPFEVKAPAQMTGKDIADLPTDVSNGGR